MELHIGTIVSYGFAFAPQGWAWCNGQTLAVDQYTTLYVLLGTTYGGDGVSTFMLPDLRGRMPLGQGQGLNLQNRVMGAVGGVQDTQLTLNNIPPHGHATVTTNLHATTSIQLANPSTSPTIAPSTTNAFIGASSGVLTAGNIFSSDASATPVTQQGVTTAVGGNVGITITGLGGAFAVENPSLVMNFSIALTGIFPSRN